MRNTNCEMIRWIVKRIGELENRSGHIAQLTRADKSNRKWTRGIFGKIEFRIDANTWCVVCVLVLMMYISAMAKVSEIREDDLQNSKCTFALGRKFVSDSCAHSVSHNVWTSVHNRCSMYNSENCENRTKHQNYSNTLDCYVCGLPIGDYRPEIYGLNLLEYNGYGEAVQCILTIVFVHLLF